ncbi:MAG: polymer-forming cytoskeletal protein [Myxococcota bacterium]
MGIMAGKRERPKATVNPADAHTILGRESRFSGKLSFDGAVRIDGHFEGEISTEELLLVGPGAEVKAKLNVGSVVISGSVEGDIEAKSSVEIKAPGRLKGNVVAPTLVIEKGVVFEGSCQMGDDTKISGSGAKVITSSPRPATAKKAS